MEGRDGSGFLTTRDGTPEFQAPEILAEEPYQGEVVDLFALGIVLFMMYSGREPFGNA